MGSISVCPPPQLYGQYCPRQATKTNCQRHQTHDPYLNYHSKSHQSVCSCKCKRVVTESETDNSNIQSVSVEHSPQEPCQAKGTGNKLSSRDDQLRKRQVHANIIRTVHITILTPKPKKRHRQEGSDDDNGNRKTNVIDQFSCRSLPSNSQKNTYISKDIYAERLFGKGMHSRPTLITSPSFKPNAMFASLRSCRESNESLGYSDKLDTRHPQNSVGGPRNYHSLSGHPCAKFRSWRQSGTGKQSDRVPTGCLKTVPNESSDSSYEYTDTCGSNLGYHIISLSQGRELETLTSRPRTPLSRSRVRHEANQQYRPSEENLQRLPDARMIPAVNKEKPNGLNVNSSEKSDIKNEYCAQPTTEPPGDNPETFTVCGLKHRATILHSHKSYYMFQDTALINRQQDCSVSEVYLITGENESREPHGQPAFDMMSTGSVNEKNYFTPAKSMSKNSLLDETLYLEAHKKRIKDPICAPPQTVRREHKSSSMSVPATSNICTNPHSPDDQHYEQQTYLDLERALLRSIYGDFENSLGTSSSDLTSLLNVLNFVRPVLTSMESITDYTAKKKQGLSSKDKYPSSESFNNSKNFAEKKSVLKANARLLNESGNRAVSETDVCRNAEHKQQVVESNSIEDNTHAQGHSSEDCYYYQPPIISGEVEFSRNHYDEGEDQENPIYYGESRPCIYSPVLSLSKSFYNSPELDESDGKDQQELYFDGDFDSSLSQSDIDCGERKAHENIVERNKAKPEACKGNSLCQNIPMGEERCIPLKEKTSPECIHNDSPGNTHDARKRTPGPCLCSPRTTQVPLTEEGLHTCPCSSLHTTGNSSDCSSCHQLPSLSLESSRATVDKKEKTFIIRTAKDNTPRPCLCCPRITQSQASKSESTACVSSHSKTNFSPSLTQSSSYPTESQKCHVDMRDKMSDTNPSLSKQIVIQRSSSTTAAYVMNADQNHYVARNGTSESPKVNCGHKQYASNTSKSSGNVERHKVKDNTASSTSAIDVDRNDVKNCRTQAQNCLDRSLKPLQEGARDKCKKYCRSCPAEKGNYLRKDGKPSANCQVFKREMEQFIEDIQIKYNEILKKSNCQTHFQVEAGRTDGAKENKVPCKLSDNWFPGHYTDFKDIEDNKSSTPTSYTMSSGDDAKSEYSDGNCGELSVSDEDEFFRDTEGGTLMSQNTEDQPTDMSLDENKEMCNDTKVDTGCGQRHEGEHGKESDEDNWLSSDKEETPEKSKSIQINTEHSKQEKCANSKMSVSAQSQQLYCCVCHKRRSDGRENVGMETGNVPTKDTVYLCTPYSEGSCHKATQNAQNACSAKKQKIDHYEATRDDDGAGPMTGTSLDGKKPNTPCNEKTHSSKYYSKAKQCLKTRNSKMACVIKKEKTASCGQAKRNSRKGQKKDDGVIQCVIKNKNALHCELEKNKYHHKERVHVRIEGTQCKPHTLCCIPQIEEQNKGNLVYCCVPITSEEQTGCNNKQIDACDGRPPDSAENGKCKERGDGRNEGNECQPANLLCIPQGEEKTEENYVNCCVPINSEGQKGDNNEEVQTFDGSHPDRAKTGEQETRISSDKGEINKGPAVGCGDLKATGVTECGTQTEDYYSGSNVGTSSETPNSNSGDSSVDADSVHKSNECNSTSIDPPGCKEESIYCEFKRERRMFLELESGIFRRSVNALMTERCFLYNICNEHTVDDLSQTQMPFREKADIFKQLSGTSPWSYKKKSRDLQSCYNRYKCSLLARQHLPLRAENHSPDNPLISSTSDTFQSPNLPENSYRCLQISPVNVENMSSKWRELFVAACYRQLQSVRQKLMSSSITF